MMRTGPLPLDELLAYFPGPRIPNGQGGFKVNCSMGHDRETPSLSITPRDNGSGPRFKCFACDADRKDILEAAGLNLDAVLPPRERPMRQVSPMGDKRSNVSQARHEIRGPSGNLVAVHVREDRADGKRYWWEQPDGTLGLGGIKSADLPLYGIDRLLAANPTPGTPVFLTEGEKAADALLANGYPAVSSVTGAAGTPADDALRPLIGRDVFLWPDADDAGREHMKRIGAALVHLGAKNVREIAWTGAPEKGDAADLFQLEAAIDELDTLIDGAQYIAATPKVQSVEAVSSMDFPVEAMSGFCGDFAKLYSSHLESSPQFFYWSALTCLGSVLSDRITLASELRPQPRLYSLLLAESADARKSTAVDKTVDFFKWAVGDFAVCWGVGSGEGLQKKMEETPRLLLGLDELKAFVNKCKIEASALLPLVNSLFESNRYESRTKTTEIKLENAYLSLLAASTIATYQNTWANAFIDIGFNNRLWLVPGASKRRFSIPPKAPEGERTRLRLMLGDVLRHVGERKELSIRPDAFNVYDDWYMHLGSSIHAKRLDTYALRLMPLLAVNDLKDEIDAGTVCKVISLCNHQLLVRQLYDPIDADNERARMEEKIRRVLRAKGAITERDLKRGVHANRAGLWLYQEAVKNLSVAGEIEWIKETRGYALKDAI